MKKHVVCNTCLRKRKLFGSIFEAVIGAFWGGVLEASWRPLGGVLGTIFGPLGGLPGALGSLVGASWGLLEASWGLLGASWGLPWAS